MATILDRPYRFDVELETAQDLMDKATRQAGRKADYRDFQVLLIVMESALKKIGYTDKALRRGMRLEIVSKLLGWRIGTFYDLTYTQAKTLQAFLAPGGAVTERQERFLDDLTETIEGQSPYTKKPARRTPALPNLW